jgi:serine-type D-Ala-D-Ala carboxypeptidase/endopeptidase
MATKRRATRSSVAILLFCISCVIPELRAQTLPTRLATSKEIRDMLVQRVDVEHKAHAIVVGLISKHGREIISYGQFGPDNPRVPDAETIFEIGSVTKVFTSLLLSEMVLDKEVNLNDPIAKYLPASVHVPSRNGKQITLLDLATHHSGLPREPSHPSDYTLEQVYDFLNHYELTRDPGAAYEYSNLGAGLLGQILAMRAGTDYETLLRTRITEPLQMNHTAIHPTEEMKANLIDGYNKDQKTPAVPIHVLAPAGAIRSNVDDMLIFLAANMGLIRTPLLPAMKYMLSVRREASSGNKIALGWHILNGGTLVCHNGGTYGYHAFVGFEPKRKIGIVVLSNSVDFTDDMAQQILHYPVSGPTEIQVGPPNLH